LVDKAKLLELVQLGHPSLKARATEISDVFDAQVQALMDDMLYTVTQSKGVGLAAPQVDVSKRLIIVASHPNERYPHAPVMAPTIMINPEILSTSDAIESDWEGCLSVPGIRGLVPRFTHVRFKFTNRQGLEVIEEYSDFLARVIQHEIDHLDGISFLERVADLKTLVSEIEFQKIIRARERHKS